MLRSCIRPNVGSMWTRMRDSSVEMVDGSEVCASSHWPANLPNVVWPASGAT